MINNIGAFLLNVTANSGNAGSKNIHLLTSIAIIVISAFLLGSIFNKIKLPPLLGMLITGIILGPYVLNLLSVDLLKISNDLKNLALIIILTRAGLSLDIKQFRKNGRSAISFCFLPASFEILGYIIFGVVLLHWNWTNAALLGTVMAAVSPAVIVPRMLKLKENGYGCKNNIPDMLIAGASVDDVYVIVLFTSFSAMALGGGFSTNIIWQIPVSILTGILVGILVGFAFTYFIKKIHIRDSIKVLILLSLAFLLIALEEYFKTIKVPFSGLLSVIVIGATCYRNERERAKRLATKYSKLWIFAEVLLFVLVGSSLDFNIFKQNAGHEYINPGMILLVMFLAIIVRMIGIYLSVIKTKLSMKERIFCMLAYTPKATVQAAIGSIPLQNNITHGGIILAFAVLGILITAPLGALKIDLTYKYLLPQDGLDEIDDDHDDDIKLMNAKSNIILKEESESNIKS